MAVGGTVVLAYIVKAVIGLRPEGDEEESGLDAADHGESGYHYDEANASTSRGQGGHKGPPLRRR